MHPMPHSYRVSASALAEGSVDLETADVPPLASAAPPEFDGPGGHWSPETLLTAAVADCFVLSFRAVATASRFPYLKLECAVEGTLDRVERQTRFTGFRLHAKLEIEASADEQRAVTLLQKAESVCLVSNSLNTPTHLTTEIVRR